MIMELLRQKRRERDQAQTIETLGEALVDALAEKNILERRLAEYEHPLAAVNAAGLRPSLETVVEGLSKSLCFAERVRYENTPSGNQLVVHSPFRGAESFRGALARWQKALEEIGFELCGFGPANEASWELRALWKGKAEKGE